MGQGSQALGDRSEAIRRQGIHRQAEGCGHDLHGVDLTVAVGVLHKLVVSRPVPGIFGAPAAPHLEYHGLGGGVQTRDLVTELVNGLAIACALAAHRQNPGAARPVLHHPLSSSLASQRLGEVAATIVFTVAGLARHRAVTGQSSLDHLRSPTTTVFHSDPEISNGARGRGKRAVGMKRVRLRQQPTELHANKHLP